MNEQEFGTELFEASAKCLEIASVAQCITEVDVNSRTAALWLNSAICNIASQLEHLAEKLEELETEFHSQGKFKYPCKIDTHTHTHTIKLLGICIETGCRLITDSNYKKLFCY